MENDDLNKAELKKALKEKVKAQIKEELKQELLDEIYRELKLEEEELTKEISSSVLKKKEQVKHVQAISTKIEEAKEDVKTFVAVKAILKIASHALKYANEKIPAEEWVEVFGLLAGKFENDVLHIEDAFPLGHGTAISWKLKDPASHERAYQDMKKEQLFTCGWYHSHPSYGCFMSNEDIRTQTIYQTLWDKAVALVIDPYQIDGTSAGFEIYRANLKSKRWFEIPYNIKGNLDVRMLPHVLEFMNPIIEGKAAYLEYDEK